jgi:hypothetical protein
MKFRISLLTFAALLLSHSAIAGTECKGKWNKQDVSAAFTWAGSALKSELTIGNDKIAPMLEFCRFEYRNYRCPHKSDNARFEVSPKLNGESITGAIVIVDTEKSSELIELTDCGS